MKPINRRIFNKKFMQRTVELIKQEGKYLRLIYIVEFRENNRDPEISFTSKAKLKPEG